MIDYDALRKRIKQTHDWSDDAELLVLLEDSEAAIIELQRILADTERRRAEAEAQAATARALVLDERQDRKAAEALLHRIRQILPSPQPPGPR